ncbi:MAG: hypothetical protein ACRCTI_15610, partial [Beijerinckiaceae bacterium]
MIRRFDDEERTQALAARAAGRLLLAAAAAHEVEDRAGEVGRADLWAYANREPGAPVDFRVEKAIRTDARASAQYGRILALRTRGMSVMAAAAYDTSATHRRLGDFSLDVVEEEGSPPALVITRLVDKATAPTMLEAVSIEGVIRVALPAEVDKMIVLDLPKDDHERDLL